MYARRITLFADRCTVFECHRVAAQWSVACNAAEQQLCIGSRGSDCQLFGGTESSLSRTSQKEQEGRLRQGEGRACLRRKIIVKTGGGASSRSSIKSDGMVPRCRPLRRDISVLAAATRSSSKVSGLVRALTAGIGLRLNSPRGSTNGLLAEDRRPAPLARNSPHLDPIRSLVVVASAVQ